MENQGIPFSCVCHQHWDCSIFRNLCALVSTCCWCMWGVAQMYRKLRLSGLMWFIIKDYSSCLYVVLKIFSWLISESRNAGFFLFSFLLAFIIFIISICRSLNNPWSDYQLLFLWIKTDLLWLSGAFDLNLLFIHPLKWLGLVVHIQMRGHCLVNHSWVMLWPTWCATLPLWWKDIDAGLLQVMKLLHLGVHKIFHMNYSMPCRSPVNPSDLIYNQDHGPVALDSCQVWFKLFMPMAKPQAYDGRSCGRLSDHLRY